MYCIVQDFYERYQFLIGVKSDDLAFQIDHFMKGMDFTAEHFQVGNTKVTGLVYMYCVHTCTQCIYMIYICMNYQSLQEKLRKARQQQQHKIKAKQHNTTHLKLSFFKEKLASSGGTLTHDHQLSRRCSYHYRGSSVFLTPTRSAKIRHLLHAVNRARPILQYAHDR